MLRKFDLYGKAIASAITIETPGSHPVVTDRASVRVPTNIPGKSRVEKAEKAEVAAKMQKARSVTPIQIRQRRCASGQSYVDGCPRGCPVHPNLRAHEWVSRRRICRSTNNRALLHITSSNQGHGPRLLPSRTFADVTLVLSLRTYTYTFYRLSTFVHPVTGLGHAFRVYICCVSWSVMEHVLPVSDYFPFIIHLRMEKVKKFWLFGCKL